MYTTQSLCRWLYYLAILLLGLAYYVLSGSVIISLASIPLAIWFGFYMRGLKISLDQDYLIRHTGRIIQHELMIKVDNISAVKSVVFVSFCPALIRVYYPGDSVLIIGLNGRQVRDLTDRLT